MPDGDEQDLRVRSQIRNLAGSATVPPTDTYLGLTLDEARALAEAEGRLLIDRSSDFSSRRANLQMNRVNVLVDGDGVVVQADVG